MGYNVCMNTQTLYPLLLDPALHVYVWGGRKLETRLGIPLPTDQPYGEAWELHDTAVVVNGALAGRTVGDLVAEYGEALIGAGNDPQEGMPLLIKFLDANDWLSVQVHPNDEQAAALEGEPRGKTEAWYVVDAEPGGELINGLKPGTTRDTLAQAIREDRVRDLLTFVEVQPGDGLFVAAGTVHAIGPGLLIYEIQQSSSTTYRLYDWGRMGLDGSPRTLHIDKGTQVANLDFHTAVVRVPDIDLETTIFDTPYFCTVRHRIDHQGVEIVTDNRFQAITCLEGALRLSSRTASVDIIAGQTVLVPAELNLFSLDGTGVALRSFQPTELT